MALRSAVYKYLYSSSKGRRMQSCSSGKVFPSWLRHTMQARAFGSHWRIHTDEA